MNTLETVLQHAEQHCKSHGAKLTQKRKLILSSLLDSGKAMSAYEIVSYCKEHYNEDMPAMSVYHILDFLEDELLVHKLNIANKYVACSHITCAHAHEVPQFLICNSCQKVQEIGIDKAIVHTLEDNISNAGYKLLSQQFELNCLCDECSHKVED